MFSCSTSIRESLFTKPAPTEVTRKYNSANEHANYTSLTTARFAHLARENVCSAMCHSSHVTRVRGGRRERESTWGCGGRARRRQRVRFALHRTCRARILVDLLHRVEVNRVGAAHGRKVYLIFSRLVRSLSHKDNRFNSAFGLDLGLAACALDTGVGATAQ